MGYDFSYAHIDPEDASQDGTPGAFYRFNGSQMALVRDLMREAGACRDDLPQALEAEGFEQTAESVDMKKFKSNDGWHVTPPECRFIATRLRAAIAERLPGEYLSFLDDVPPTKVVAEWLEEFAAYNARAAEVGGYKVR